MHGKTVSRVVLACLLIALFAVGTLADEFSFFSPIVGSNPGVTIATVPSGGAPWVVRHGVAILTDDGRLRVEVRGLILPSTGNTGPVTQVAASVVCGDVVAATSKSVNIKTDGDFQLRDHLSLPSPCLGAVILIRVTGANGSPLQNPGPWIAASGTIKDADDL
jgi:hypothetical protein